MTRLIVVLLGLSCVSCATSADTRLAATKSQYPISLSQSFVDERGEIYRPHEEEVVGRFKRSWRQWDWFYGMVNLTRGANLSRLVASEVEKREGDAVVNLRVTARYSKIWYVTSWFILLPDSIGVTVEGDVVRRPSSVQ